MTLVCKDCGFKTEDPNVKECPACRVALVEEVEAVADKSLSEQKAELEAVGQELDAIEKVEEAIEQEDEDKAQIIEKAEMNELEAEEAEIEKEEDEIETALGDKLPVKHIDDMVPSKKEEPVVRQVSAEKPKLPSDEGKKKKSLVTEL